MLTNAEIKRIKNIQEKAKARREAGLFVIEGEKLVMEAPLEWIEKIYITEECLDRLSDYKTGTAITNPAEIISWMDHEIITSEQMKRISDTQTPQGILCLVNCPGYSMDDILSDSRCKRAHRLIAVLEDIRDPGNLGTIFRSAEGAGASGIIMSSNCVDIFNPKTVRSTMGSIYRVPFILSDDLSDSIKELKQAGIKIYAAHLHGECFYYETEYEDAAFLIGNEANGLTKDISELADMLIKIPMEGKLESLNASVAASILMYHHYVSTL